MIPCKRLHFGTVLPLDTPTLEKTALGSCSLSTELPDPGTGEAELDAEPCAISETPP